MVTAVHVDVICPKNTRFFCRIPFSCEIFKNKYCIQPVNSVLQTRWAVTSNSKENKRLQLQIVVVHSSEIQEPEGGGFESDPNRCIDNMDI